MKITFQKLKKKDRKTAVAYAVRGMHCEVYFGSRFLSRLYGRFLLDYGLSEATKCIAAYDEEKFLGLLLARMEGEERCFHAFSLRFFLFALRLAEHLPSGGGAGDYGSALQEMLRAYKENTDPDGEITFLSIDPDLEGQGIGTAILAEFERQESGKTVYLNTDDQCTYQFYDARGFTRVGEKDVVMGAKNKITLKCMLYSKKI